MKSKYISILIFILSLLCSNANDALSKLISVQIPAVEIAFFRSLFGAISMLIFMLITGRTLRTHHIQLHIVRGTLFFIAIMLWIAGLKTSTLTIATMSSFTIPVFTIILAPRLLSEHVGAYIWTAVITCFIGIIIALGIWNASFTSFSMLLLLSSLIFAFLDIVNKKYISQDGIYNMVFYSSVVAAMCGLVPSIHVWDTPTIKELAALSTLGLLGNVMLFCILYAFKLSNISFLAPFRYLELPISAVSGYLLFNELPTWNIYASACLIIPSTFFILLHETKINTNEKSI